MAMTKLTHQGTTCHRNGDCRGFAAGGAGAAAVVVAVIGVAAAVVAAAAAAAAAAVVAGFAEEEEEEEEEFELRARVSSERANETRARDSGPRECSWVEGKCYR